jgi:hypothetical protein
MSEVPLEESSMKALITAVFVLALAGWIGDAKGEEGHGHKHANHAHDAVEVVNLSKAPTVELMVEKDRKSGWNVSLVTTNFAFAPDKVNTTHLEGEGHAHLYVDGQKQRIYCPFIHLDGLEPGRHTLRVTLNGNDHREYAVKGQIVEDTVVITQ